jgi:hypothetical protein
LPGLEPVHFVFPRAFVGTLGATYASRGARHSALSIESTIQYHVHRRVELPSGAKLVRKPEAIAVTHPSMEAARKVSVGPSAIEEDFTLSLPSGTVEAAGYQAFVEKVRAVDDGFMMGSRVRVKP